MAAHAQRRADRRGSRRRSAAGRSATASRCARRSGRARTARDEWPFEIVGIYGSATAKVPSNELWINYAYFDEARAFGNGTVTLYFARIDDPSRRRQIAERIDRPVRELAVRDADAERARLAAQRAFNQIGNIGFFVNAIIAAVMFTLLFLTGNTMMQSVRERIPELAVLKTYGFSNTAVMTVLVFAESLLLCLLAAGDRPRHRRADRRRAIFRVIGAGGISLPLERASAPAWASQRWWRSSARCRPRGALQRISIVDALAGR